MAARPWRLSMRGGQKLGIGRMPGSTKSALLDDKLVINEVPDKRLALNYVGAVGRVPSATTLPLTTAFGDTFYMEGAKHTETCTEQFIPAWIVPSAIKSQQKVVASQPKAESAESG